MSMIFWAKVKAAGAAAAAVAAAVMVVALVASGEERRPDAPAAIEVAEVTSPAPAPVAETAAPAEDAAAETSGPGESTDVTPKEALVRGNTAFALDMYARLKGAKGNVFFSPYSISTALAMTYAGARGNTAKQMASVMHFSLGDDKLHAAFSELQGTLKGEVSKEGYELAVANRLFGQRGYSFRKPFLDVNRVQYGSPLEELNFRGDSAGARRRINSWVEEQTRERIKDIVKPPLPTPDTKLVLANAIYFLGEWREKFNERSTRDKEFRAASGPVMVPMMHQAKSFAHMQGDGFAALELPYKSGDISMVIFLPDAVDGIGTLESKLGPAFISDSIGKLQHKRVFVMLPKFKMTFEDELSSRLSEMGMTDAFAYGPADFSGMDGTRELYIGAVLHKAFVEVNETGTEAAAATIVVMRTGAAPGRPIDFHCNRPFIFVIRDTRSGSVLFMGRVADPSKGV